jgi:hypothetical protein
MKKLQNASGRCSPFRFAHLLMLCLITAAIDSDDFQQELLGRIIQMRESTHTHTDSCVQLLAAARRASPVHFSITNIIGDKTKQKRKNTEEK